MFTKSDKKFDQIAADPARRRDAIARYATQRNITGICAMMIAACAILEILTGRESAAAGVFFAATVNWIICIKADSDLRLLKVIDRLEKGSDEKPVA